ncbi:YihY/virulence factor BrkB family protein [Terrihabitans sp. B22-R8]|uniref:YihY/virulence factor BrkB family protein n=1 Tax=Terrihabitans sp. B22-R8 TaxID=3425128 RepID=UPI00403CB674
MLKSLWSIFYSVYVRFEAHDAWAISSHVALGVLLAIFPFLIVVTALASLIGTPEAANEVVGLAFEGWPGVLADPLSSEVTRVLTGRRIDVLTIGVLLLLWTASSAVEAMRIALVRAYGLPDTRAWWLNRIQSIGFMLLGAFGMLLLSVTVVLWTPIWDFATSFTPPLRLITGTADSVRYAGTGLFLAGGLVLAHLWLPPQRISIVCVLPGTLLTLFLWLLSASVFGFWLAGFANYASTYAGLGGIMAVIFFLYINSASFILGGELNAVLLAFRKKRDAARQADAKMAEPA